MNTETAPRFNREGTFWDGWKEKTARGEKLWDHAHFILADVPIDYDAVKRILPVGMWPVQPAAATVFIADYADVAFPLFPYHEAGLLVHVRTLLGTGRHCCWMLVDDDTALILGREMLGYPKKIGKFEFIVQDGNVKAAVARRGVRIMELEGKRGSPVDPRPAVFDLKTYHVGAMGQFLSLNPVWLFRPKEVIHEYYSAEVKLSLNDSDFDPIKRLAAGEPYNGRIVIMDIPGDGYMLPVGLAGPVWFGRTFNMRFR